MSFSLDPESGIPIYIQLKEKIKLAVATGRYLPGTQLPTVRQLAVELRINPNTVARVYSELENEGVLATKQGKGTFVRDQPEVDSHYRDKRLDEILDTIILKAASLGFSTKDLLEALKTKIKGGKTNG